MEREIFSGGKQPQRGVCRPREDRDTDTDTDADTDADADADADADWHEAPSAADGGDRGHHDRGLLLRLSCAGLALSRVLVRRMSAEGYARPGALTAAAMRSAGR
jgi:hypothetical protein